jgi:hypothetical protein
MNVNVILRLALISVDQIPSVAAIVDAKASNSVRSTRSSWAWPWAWRVHEVPPMLTTKPQQPSNLIRLGVVMETPDCFLCNLQFTIHKTRRLSWRRSDICQDQHNERDLDTELTGNHRWTGWKLNRIQKVFVGTESQSENVSRWKEIGKCQTDDNQPC